MIPVEPTVDGARLIVFGAEQPEYLELPVAVDADGMVTTEWELTEHEVDLLMLGGRIRLRVHTFDPLLGTPGHYLQPVSLDVLEPECGMRES